MSLPPKIQSWLDNNKFPQRVLLSGGDEGLEIAMKIAAQLQSTDVERIGSGIHEDTVVFRDNGKSFKIAYSDTARKDGQSEFENVRGIVKWISQKPINPWRIVILENLERASREAPQALLKILEEPPPQGVFIFTTKNHHQILETILSRITVVNLPKTNNQRLITNNQVESFLKSSSLIDRFRIIEVLDAEVKKEKDKRILHTFMTDLIEACRKDLSKQVFLELLYETQQALNGNANPKLTLERLAMKMKEVY